MVTRIEAVLLLAITAGSSYSCSSASVEGPNQNPDRPEDAAVLDAPVDGSQLQDAASLDPDGPPPPCGDGVCAADETEATCVDDCSPDTCAMLTACAEGQLFFFRFTQDIGAICSTKGACLSGGGSCAIGSHSLIGLCLSGNPDNDCASSEVFGPYTAHTECS